MGGITTLIVSVYVNARVYICLCVRARACVCLSVRMREWERERKTGRRERERGDLSHISETDRAENIYFPFFFLFSSIGRLSNTFPRSLQKVSVTTKTVEAICVLCDQNLLCMSVILVAGHAIRACCKHVIFPIFLIYKQTFHHLICLLKSRYCWLLHQQCWSLLMQD